MVIYFIQDVRGNVKIGRTNDLSRRLETLQSGRVDPIWVMRVVPGDGAAERWYHKRFAPQRIVREWFDFHIDMLTVLAPDEVTNTLPPRMRDWKTSTDVEPDRLAVDAFIEEATSRL